MSTSAVEPSRVELDAIRTFFDAAAFGQPWVVSYRGTEVTAVAIKKCGGRDDEIIWDYTWDDGGGDVVHPEEFARLFIPVAPMVPLTAPVEVTAPPRSRPGELQVALWAALAAPLEVSELADVAAGLQSVVDQADDRAAAFPALLTALVAERDPTRRQSTTLAELRESVEDLIGRWRGHAPYGSDTMAERAERAVLKNAAADLFDVVLGRLITPHANQPRARGATPRR
jgi:hypothetical protein